MQRCPNCNARGDGSSTCRRCGMDLTLPLRAERTAERLTRLALERLAVGDSATAAEALGLAQSMHRTPLAEQLLGLIRQREAEGRRALEQFLPRRSRTLRPSAAEPPRDTPPRRIDGGLGLEPKSPLLSAD